MKADLPFPRSYWVKPGRLLAGFLPGDLDPSAAEARLTALLDCGVTDVICLMEEAERDHAGRVFSDYRPLLEKVSKSRQRPVNWSRHPIRDLNVPVPEEMSDTLEVLDAAMEDGCVYVHCWGGRGRTGTVVGCWLARHGIAVGEAALDHLAVLTAHAREYFPHIPETRQQQEFVRNWKQNQ